MERWGAVSVFGINEIPARIIFRMGVSSNVYNAMRSYNAGKSQLARWAKHHTAELEIVSMVREMRRHDNA